MAGPTRGRLAPSPTGAQHVGNARTFLIAWLHARSKGGQILLRIEDIDLPRVKPGAQQQALDDLHWLGLDWDGEPVFQTVRLHHYVEAFRALQAKELVYPCTCSRSDIERAGSAPHAEHEGPRYPGTCSWRTAVDASTLAGRPFAWRFRTPNRDIQFDDLYRGPQCLNSGTLGGDFVVWKSDGTPAYQLAVVVDDAAQGITEVIRGDDLLSSTPRQLLLYQSLQTPPPQFGHVPLVIGPDGHRLAKRHGDTRLAALRESGVKPNCLIGLMAWSCGWSERIESITPLDLISRFNLSAIPQEPLVLTSNSLKQIGYEL